MANEKHLFLTARGTYTATGDTPEIWMNGIRLVCVFGTVSTDGDLPNTWDVFEDIQSSSDGGVDYVGNFALQGPPTFTFDPVSYLHDYAVPTMAARAGSLWKILRTAMPMAARAVAAVLAIIEKVCMALTGLRTAAITAPSAAAPGMLKPAAWATPPSSGAAPMAPRPIGG